MTQYYYSILRISSKSVLTIFFLSLFCNTLNAQKNLADTGAVTKNDLLNKECEFEKNASAMVIFDVQKTKFEPRYSIYGRVTTVKKIRIKIFGERGFEKANIKIDYFPENVIFNINDITGLVYNLDESGNIIVSKISPDQIFQDNNDKYSKSIRFTFPDIRPGTIIEYTYKYVENNVFSIQPWVQQSTIPVRLSYFELNTPAYCDLEFIINGPFPVDTIVRNIRRRSYLIPEMLTIFRSYNLPSFVSEPYATSVRDNIQRIDFYVSSNRNLSFLFEGEKDMPSNSTLRWNFFRRMLATAPFFGEQFNTNIDGTENIIKKAIAMNSVKEKIYFIYDTIKEIIKWNGEIGLVARDLNKCWKTRTGNNTELNIIVLNLLRKCGVETSAILTSTRSHGKPNPNFPDFSQFNSTALLISDNQKNYIIDVTTKYTSPGVPPHEIMNRYALVIDSAKEKWVAISDTRPLYKVVSIFNSFIDSNAQLKSESTFAFYDYAREAILGSRDYKGKEEEKDQTVSPDLQEIEIGSFVEENKEDREKPLINKFKFSRNITNTGSFYYLNPVLINNFRNNPFIAEKRTTDIDFGSNHYYFITMNLTIPENMEFESLPKNILLINSDSTLWFQRNSAFENKSAMFRLIFEIRSPIFSKEEYPDIKDFYKKLFTLLNEQIILRKVN